MKLRDLLITTFLVSFSTPANAGPILGFAQGLISFITTGATVGAGIGGAFAFGSQIGAFFTSSILGRFVFSIGLSYIRQALARRRASQPSQNEVKSNYAQDTVYFETCYGTMKKGGFLGFTGFADNSRHNVVIVAAHETESLLRVWLDKTEVFVDSAGLILTAPFAGFGSVRYRDGSPGQVVDPVLDAAFTEVTSAFNFEGLTYLAMQADRVDERSFATVYPNGKEWQVSGLFKMNNQIFDPRDNVTKWTDNAALIIAHAATQRGKTVVWSEVATEADVCDRVVINGDGLTQKLWTINGVVRDSETWEDVRLRLAIACDAFFSEDPDGAIRFKVGRYEEPSVILTQADFYELDIADKAWGPDVNGKFSVVYVEPARDWSEAESGAYVLDADGDASSEPANMIYSHNQACRVAKRLALSTRPDYAVSGKLKLVGLDLLGQRFFRLRVDELPDFDHVFEVGKITESEDGFSFDVEGTSVNASDWELEDEPDRPVYLDINATDVVPEIVGLSASVVTGANSVGTIVWTWPLQDSIYKQELRIKATTISPTDWQVLTMGDGQISFVQSGAIDGETYIGQIRNRTLTFRTSEYRPTPEVSVVAVANTVAPVALTSNTASVSGPLVTITWVSTNDVNLKRVRVYRALGSTLFSSAVLRTAKLTNPNTTDSYVDTTAAPGTYTYWCEPINASGVAGPRLAPVTVTVI